MAGISPRSSLLELGTLQSSKDSLVSCCIEHNSIVCAAALCYVHSLRSVHVITAIWVSQARHVLRVNVVKYIPQYQTRYLFNYT
jgi:hypothetical protein